MWRGTVPFLGGHGRGHAGRVALVLDVGLHADQRDRVAVGAHAQARHQIPSNPLGSRQR